MEDEANSRSSRLRRDGCEALGSMPVQSSGDKQRRVLTGESSAARIVGVRHLRGATAVLALAGLLTPGALGVIAGDLRS